MYRVEGRVDSGAARTRYQVIASHGTNAAPSLSRQISRPQSIATHIRGCANQTPQTPPVAGAAVQKSPGLGTSMRLSDTCDSVAVLPTLPSPPPSSPPCPTHDLVQLPLHHTDLLTPKVCTPFVPQAPPAFCPPPRIQLCDLTPPRLLEIAQFYGQDYIIPHVSRIQFEAWLASYPELEDDSNRKNYWLRYTHAEVPIGEGIYVPGLIVKCMPSAYHEACTDFFVAETIAVTHPREKKVPKAYRLTCRANTVFRNFTNYSSNLSPTAGKAPDMAMVVGMSPFPTIAVEVGFSETWASLLEDARLFLTGTGGMTRFVILIHLAEEVATGEYTNRVTGQKVKCWKAKQEQFKWPCEAFGVDQNNKGKSGGDENAGGDQDPPDKASEENRDQGDDLASDNSGSPVDNIPPVIIPPPPPNKDNVNNDKLLDVFREKLKTYFLAADAHGALLPPLLAPISATLYLYHLRDASSPAADANSDTDPTLFCATKVPFMERDVPLPEANFELTLDKVYASPLSLQARSGAEVPGEGEKIVYDLESLGVDIVSAQGEMRGERVAARAKRVIEGWCEGVRREGNKVSELKRREERERGGEKETRKVRKRVVIPSEAQAYARTGFANVKRAKLEGRTERRRGGTQEGDGEADEPEDEINEDEGEEDDITRDGNWTE